MREGLFFLFGEVLRFSVVIFFANKEVETKRQREGKTKRERKKIYDLTMCNLQSIWVFKFRLHLCNRDK